MGIMSDLSLRLSANTAELKNGLADATQELNNFGKDAKTAAAKITDSFKDVGMATSNIKEMRTALQSLKGISFAGKSKEEIQAINAEIGRLTDEMGDLKAMQNGMGTEFGSLMASGLQAVAAIGEVAVGVASMFGASKEEAEKYQKVMTTLIGVTQGLGVIQDAFGTRLFQIIGLRLKETAATASQTIATIAQTAAQWALNASLLVVIGTLSAVVVVIAAVTAGIYLLVTAHREETKEIEKKNQQYKDTVNRLGLINQEEQTQLNIRKARGEQGAALLKDELSLMQAQRSRLAIQFNELEALGKSTDLTAKQKEALKKYAEEWHKLGNEIRVKKAEIITATENEAKAEKLKAESAKGAYEVLSTSISDTEKKIKDVIASGGVVSPEMLETLGRYYNELEKANKEAERLQKLSYGRVDDKIQKITPIVSKSVTPSIPITIDTKMDTKSMDGFLARNKQKFQNWSKEISKEAQVLNDNVVVGLNQLGSSIAQSFADMVTGEEGAGFSALFKGILSVVGEFITQMGAAVMSYGITMEAFKKAFTNPYAAIAAGLGLMVAGGVVSNLANSLGQKAQGFANGGIVGGNSYSGDKVPVMTNSGEMILNGRQQAELFAMANSGTTNSNSRGNQVEFIIRGDKLVGILNNYNRKISNTR